MAREESTSDTGLHRLLRRVVPNPATNERITHRQLMEASEERIAKAADSQSLTEKMAATRILDCPREYQRWEEEHGRLMQRVADKRDAEAQRTELLSAAFALIHRKALFEYLRDKHVLGTERQRLLTQFHGGRDYAASFVHEHAIYLRSTLSFVCVRSIARRVLQDHSVDASLSRYERLYAEYFGAFCRSVGEESTQTRASVVMLKHRVNEMRIEILGTSSVRTGTWRAISPIGAR